MWCVGETPAPGQPSPIRLPLPPQPPRLHFLITRFGWKGVYFYLKDDPIRSTSLDSKFNLMIIIFTFIYLYYFQLTYDIAYRVFTKTLTVSADFCDEFYNLQSNIRLKNHYVQGNLRADIHNVQDKLRILLWILS